MSDETCHMSTEIVISRPPKTLPGAAPVAMQHGRGGDRIALAQLRVKRRWLLRRCLDATVAPSSPAYAPTPKPGSGPLDQLRAVGPRPSSA